MTFEVVANARKVVVDRFGVDIMTHENCEETQGFGCGINRTMVEVAKGEV